MAAAGKPKPPTVTATASATNTLRKPVLPAPVPSTAPADDGEAQENYINDNVINEIAAKIEAQKASLPPRKPVQPAQAKVQTIRSPPPAAANVLPPIQPDPHSEALQMQYMQAQQQRAAQVAMAPQPGYVDPSADPNQSGQRRYLTPQQRQNLQKVQQAQAMQPGMGPMGMPGGAMMNPMMQQQQMMNPMMQQQQMMMQQQQQMMMMRPMAPRAQLAPGAMGVPGYGMSPARPMMPGMMGGMQYYDPYAGYDPYSQMYLDPAMGMDPYAGYMGGQPRLLPTSRSRCLQATCTATARRACMVACRP